jgi:hypothetical protein
MDRVRFKSMTAFLDMLWILLAGFGAMFIIAYLLIQPPAKNADVIKKAEFIITLEWEPTSEDDLDIWIRDPSGNVVSFTKKAAGLMNLEKDDLGKTNDSFTDENGNVHTVFINKEVITLRGVVAGEYEVMIHVYSRKYQGGANKGFDTSQGNLSVEVIKINPYKVVYKNNYTYDKRGQEISVVRFSIASDGSFISYNNIPSDIIFNSRYNPPAGRDNPSLWRGDLAMKWTPL